MADKELNSMANDCARTFIANHGESYFHKAMAIFDEQEREPSEVELFVAGMQAGFVNGVAIAAGLVPGTMDEEEG